MPREPATTRRNLPASSSVSKVARGANTAAADSRAQICPEANLVVLLMIPLAPARDAHGGLPQHRLLLSADAVLVDRKSTRLNSSHRCISYAVFCLKKKNKSLNLRFITEKVECIHRDNLCAN